MVKRIGPRGYQAVTPNQLLILCAVRTLQPTSTRRVARLLSKAPGTVANCAYGQVGPYFSMFRAGWLRTGGKRRGNTLMLTEAGGCLVQRCYLIFEGDGVKLGRLERIY